MLRGAAIVAVVYLHAYFTPWPEVSEGGLTALRLAHLVAHGAVPLFLFIAAFLQAAGPRESLAGHLRGRWWSTWLPAFVWMAASFAYRVFDEGFSGGLLTDLALFDIAGQFYFVWLVLVFGLALTQAPRLQARWWPLVLGGAFVVNLAAIAFYEWRGDLSGWDATLAYRNPLAWVFFPVLGYWLGAGHWRTASRRLALGGAGTMFLAASAYLVQGLAFDDWPVSYFGVSVFGFSAGGLLFYPAVARRLAATAGARPLTALSRYAFPIFLVHLPFVMGFGTQYLLGDGAAWSNYWLLLHANAVVGFLVSLALVREADKASPRIGSLLLGVRRRGRSRGFSGPGGPPPPAFGFKPPP